MNGFLSEKQTQGIWNYGVWEPLVLNIIVGKQAWYAAILKQDDDHILIRFGKDPSEMMQPGSINHAETRRLTRISASKPATIVATRFRSCREGEQTEHSHCTSISGMTPVSTAVR